jgi:hypothetical protein
VTGNTFRLRGHVEEIKREEDRRARTYPGFSDSLDTHSSSAGAQTAARFIVWSAVLIAAWVFREDIVRTSVSVLLLPIIIIVAIGAMSGILGGRSGATGGALGGVGKIFVLIFKMVAKVVNWLADTLGQVVGQTVGEHKRNQLNRKHAEKIFIVYTVPVRILNADRSSEVRSVRMDGQFKGRPIKKGDDVELWGTVSAAGALLSAEGFNHTEKGPISMGPV